MPNIVFILSDDQGAWAMGCAGTPEIHTPHLDRIAREGVRFDQFFCASPVCSPARASLLTGRIPSAHGVHDWIRSGNLDAGKFSRQSAENPYDGGYAEEKEPIAYLEGMPCYTDMLKRAGYACALSGKWHLGDSIRPQHGFAHWYTLGKGGCFYYHPDVVENGDITVRHGEYVTDLITDRACQFIDALSGKENPFYLSVHYTAPHAPWGKEHHPKKWLDYYASCDFSGIPDVPDHENLTTGPVYGTKKRRENLTGYFAAVSAMDEGIGRILDKLEEKGILDDTLIIFAGDNGMSMGHHGVWGKGNGTFPCNMYDTAVKVPFLMRFPALCAPGTVIDEMASALDIFPTLAEIIGQNPPDHLPGKSLLPLLRGEKGWEHILIADEYGPVRMIRTKEWKYIHRYPFGPHELYDLEKDPGEECNLIDDPLHQEKILTLRREMEAYFLRFGDPALDGAKEGANGSGQFCRPGIFASQPRVYGDIPLTDRQRLQKEEET